MSSSIAAMIRGFTNGYEAGDRMKQRKEDREREKRERELQDQDRQIARDERQQKKDYAAKVASNIATVGLPKEVDAGGGYKFTGPQAGVRAQQFIDENNDPEFGIASQGVNTAPLNEKPQANGLYTRKDEINERIKLAGQVGDVDEVKAARAELANLYNEGVGQALQAFKQGGPQAAIKAYNEYGIDRFTDKFEEIEGGYRLYRPDGSAFDVNPDEIERNQLDILKRAQLAELLAKTKARQFQKVGDGQDLYDTENNTVVVSNPKTFNPRTGINGGGRGGGDGLGPNRFRLSQLRELRQQLQNAEKRAGDFTISPDLRKQAAAEAETLRLDVQDLRAELYGKDSSGNTNVEPIPKNQTESSGTANYVFDKATGRLVLKTN